MSSGSKCSGCEKTKHWLFLPFDFLYFYVFLHISLHAFHSRLETNEGWLQTFAQYCRFPKSPLTQSECTGKAAQHKLTLQTLSHVWMWWKVRGVCWFKAALLLYLHWVHLWSERLGYSYWARLMAKHRCWPGLCTMYRKLLLNDFALPYIYSAQQRGKDSLIQTNPSLTGSDLCWSICRNKRWRTPPSEEQIKPEETLLCVLPNKVIMETQNCVDDSALKHLSMFVSMKQRVTELYLLAMPVPA